MPPLTHFFILFIGGALGLKAAVISGIFFSADITVRRLNSNF